MLLDNIYTNFGNDSFSKKVVFPNLRFKFLDSRLQLLNLNLLLHDTRGEPHHEVFEIFIIFLLVSIVGLSACISVFLLHVLVDKFKFLNYNSYKVLINLKHYKVKHVGFYDCKEEVSHPLVVEVAIEVLCTVTPEQDTMGFWNLQGVFKYNLHYVSE